MTPDDLCKVLRELAAGQAATIPRVQFEQVFQDYWTMEDRKVAAIGLAERCGCSIFFTGVDAAFVRITKRQDRTRLVTSERPPRSS